MTVIQIKNLNFHYSRKQHIYNQLDLNIEKGSVSALLGLNGAGKTTLLNLIAGFLIPKNGTCEVFGYPSSKRYPEMLKELFMVADITEFPNLTVEQFYKLYYEFYPKFDKSFFEHCLSRFNLSLSNSLKRLSLGEKRKVVLSFALATRCKLLLFDEPTNGLDIPSKSTFRKLIAESIDENQTILIATHQVRDLSNLMDRIIIENQGKIILNETTERISEKLAFGLKTDYIKKEDLIYTSEGYSSNDTVSINRNNDTGPINIELLFNAAISNPGELSSLLNTNNQTS